MLIRMIRVRHLYDVIEAHFGLKTLSWKTWRREWSDHSGSDEGRDKDLYRAGAKIYRHISNIQNTMVFYFVWIFIQFLAESDETKNV